MQPDKPSLIAPHSEDIQPTRSLLHRCVIKHMAYDSPSKKPASLDQHFFFQALKNHYSVFKPFGNSSVTKPIVNKWKSQPDAGIIVAVMGYRERQEIL